MRHKNQVESVTLSRAQRLILIASAKDPRGNAPCMIEGVTRGVAWVRDETLEKLREMGLMDNVCDLSEWERVAEDALTIVRTKLALGRMESGDWSGAHELLRKLVDMTELRHAQVWRITTEGREWVASRRRRRP